MTFSNRPAPLPFFKTDFPLFLAPMAGVTDPIFRTICKELGVDVMVTEFVSAEGILQAWERNRRYAKIENAHRPIGIQLFGADGNHMGEAAMRSRILSTSTSAARFPKWLAKMEVLPS